MAIYKPKEMAKKLNVAVRTLQRWDIEGKLLAKRSLTSKRYYTDDQLMQFLGKPTNNHKVVAYARVSTYGQKDDLKDQINFTRQYANSKWVILDEAITDIGSGLNYNRKKWNQLLHGAEQNKAKTIFITYRDRFMRFGFNWFNRFCNEHNTKIAVLNNPNTLPDKEVVDDVLSVIHVFSCRLYRLRKYKNKIKNDKSLAKEDGEHGYENTKN